MVGGIAAIYSTGSISFATLYAVSPSSAAVPSRGTSAGSCGLIDGTTGRTAVDHRVVTDSYWSAARSRSAAELTGNDASSERRKRFGVRSSK